MFIARATRQSQNIQRLCRFSMQTQMLFASQRMSLMTLQQSNAARKPTQITGGQVDLRYFSSLPGHVKLEMPNLSPTMEKVSSIST